MANRTPLQKRRDLAYGCFILPGALNLIGSLSTIVPSGDIEPAYFGFFFLIPLTLLSVIAVITAGVLTIMIGRQDPILIALLTATLAIFGAMLAVASDITFLGIDDVFANILSGIYGLFTIGISANWFFVRRKNLQ